MRSPILESWVVHLLNEDHEMAAALFKKYMIEVSRKIHENLRQGGMPVLEDGWDHEIDQEEYFDNNDLDDAVDSEDDAEGDVEEVESDLDDTEDAADQLETDLDSEDVEGDEAESVEDRIEDMEDRIEDLTAEFEKMMAEIEGDSPHNPEEDFEDMSDEEDEDMHDDMEDETSEEMADRMDDDMSDEEDDASDVETDQTDSVEEDEEYDDDEMLDDITESVLAELEKVSVSLADGKDSSGKMIAKSDGKSVLPNHSSKERGGAKAYTPAKSQNHDNYQRQPSPPVKGISSLAKNVKNSRTKATDKMSPVAKEGDKNAALNKDFAGVTKK